VPFPFVVGSAVFQSSDMVEAEGWGRFSRVPDWLPEPVGGAPDMVVAMIASLVQRVKEVGVADGSNRVVHGVVLPELALDRGRARALADALAKDLDVELLVTGVFAGPEQKGVPGRNLVRSYLFDADRKPASWKQSKHHRWRLDRGQLERYGFELDPRYLWWEDIDVRNREVVVFAFRDGATLATLVCDDPAFVRAAQKVLEDRSAQAKEADEFLRDMGKELRRRAVAAQKS
jgi:hypothetical protein